MTEFGENPPVPETYYDPHTQRLVIGRAALQSETTSQEMGDYDFETPPDDDTPAAYQSLPELLTGKDFPYRPSELSHNTGKIKYDADAITELGAWTYKLVQQTGSDTLHGGHFHRLHLIGLSPSMRHVRATVDLRVLRDELGTKTNRHQSDVSGWTHREWRQYAEKVHNALPDGPRPPTDEDYNALASTLHGPSMSTIRAKFGSIGDINELLGYVNARAMDADDMVDWGVAVSRANPDRKDPLTQNATRVLASRRAGPSYEFIGKICGNFREFKRKVRERLQEIEQEERARVDQRLQRFEEIVAHSPRDKDARRVEPENMSTEDKLAFAAKYDLMLAMLGQEAQARAWNAADKMPSDVVLRIRQTEPSITSGMVELQASMLGIMDDIWRPNHRPKALQVSDEALDAYDYHKKKPHAAAEPVPNSTLGDVRQAATELVLVPTKGSLKQLLAIRRELASARELYAYLLEGSQGGEEPVEYMTRALDILSEEVIPKLEAGIAASEEIERRL